MGGEQTNYLLIIRDLEKNKPEQSHFKAAISLKFQARSRNKANSRPPEDTSSLAYT
jgi:hypothetical protein